MRLPLLRLFLLCGLLLSEGKVRAQVADFAMSKSSGCAPEEISFTDKSTGVSGASLYNWDFGDGKSSVLKDPSTTYSAPGVYTVRLSVRNGSGGTPSIKTATVTIYGSPSPAYTVVPATGCPCTEVAFTNTSVANAPGAVTAQWSFGDGTVDMSLAPKHVYCLPGKYNIALKVTNSAGCVGTRKDTSKITIHNPPEGAFRASKTFICKVPDSIVFTATGSSGKPPYRYQWDFGDGSPMTAISSDPVVRHRYMAYGTYSVRLLLSDANGCVDTIFKENMITATPTRPDFKVPAAACQGNAPVLFLNSSIPTPLYTRWLWSDGGGGSGSAISRSTLVPGIVSVMMIDSFGIGCVDTVVKPYTINPKPKARFSYAPIYPCPAPATISFMNGSSGADTYTWIFGDGTTSTAKNPAHTYLLDSVYSVFMIARSAVGCLDTTRVRDTTKPFPFGYPSPFYDSSNSPVIIRVMQARAVITVDSSGGCIPFTVKPRVQVHSYTEYPRAADTAKYPACLWREGYTFMPYWSCAMMLGPDAYPDEFVDPPGSVVSGSYNKIYHRPIKYYLWDFGDGVTSTDSSPVHVYTVEGTHRIRVRVTTDNGCVLYDSTDIVCGQHPKADFTVDPLDICIHESVTITNRSSLGFNYQWRFGDGKGLISSRDDTVFSHRYDDAGIMRILLIANRYGCLDTMSIPVVVRPPDADFYFSYSCDTPLLIRFADRSVEATSLLWRFGDGATATDRNPSHLYSAPGTYQVKLITWNNIYGCSDSTVAPITVYIPELYFSASDTAICKGDSVRFNAIPRTYIDIGRWLVNGALVGDTVFSHAQAFPDTGSFSIMYIAIDNHGCHDTFYRPDYILVGKPAARFTAVPMAGCAPLSVRVTASGKSVQRTSITKYSWYFGTLSATSGTAVTAAYTFPAGKHDIALVAMDNIGCSDTVHALVDARQPKADFSSDAPEYACLNQKVNFYNSSAGTALKCTWYFGDGSTATDFSPVHIYRSIGVFDVTLVIEDDLGCRDSLTKKAFMKTTTPEAGFTMNDSVSVCPPLFVSFTNTSSSAGTFLWDFDNGSTAAIRDPVVPFIDSGVYHVVLVATDRYGCRDTATSVVHVFGYNGALTYTPLLGCVPLEVSFESNLFRAAEMLWDFADGVTESIGDSLKTKHTYLVPGAYVPRIILGDGKGCRSSSIGLDTIRVDDIAARAVTGPACVGQEVLFADSSYSLFSAIVSSSWFFHDGSSQEQRAAVYRYDTSGVYRVMLVSVNKNGCRDTVMESLTVHELPQLDARDTVICLGDRVQLLPRGALSYEWLPDPELSCTDCPDPWATPQAPAAYYYSGTDMNGCRNRDTVRVGIRTKSVLFPPRDTSVCAGTPVRLSAGGAALYTWIPGQGLDDPRSDRPLAILDTTTRFLIVGREGSCIPDTAQLIVEVYPLPRVDAGPDQRVPTGTVVTLQGTVTGAASYNWAPADLLSCVNCLNPDLNPKKAVTYTLKATSEYGCVDSDDVTIVLFCAEGQLFLPNTFTPNGDGQNDRFYPQGKGIALVRNFRVYNRWGQLLFERAQMQLNTPEEGWNGKFQGAVLGPDTFVYTLEAVCDNGELLFWKGDVSLLR